MGRSKTKQRVILIIHDIRSAHNVGAMFRTADGAGVSEIILSGYTPVPPKEDALYLSDAEKALRKTALGAEGYIPWRKVTTLSRTLAALRKAGCEIVALEQGEGSIDYRTYRPTGDVALIVGNEVLGVDAKLLKRSDRVIEIPMRGQKNSLNVSVAAGIALYQITGTIKK